MADAVFLELLMHVNGVQGCVATVYFFGYLTGACATEPVLSWVIYVAEKKMHLKPEVAFLRGIPANALGNQFTCFTGAKVQMLY